MCVSSLAAWSPSSDIACRQHSGGCLVLHRRTASQRRPIVSGLFYCGTLGNFNTCVSCHCITVVVALLPVCPSGYSYYTRFVDRYSGLSLALGDLQGYSLTALCLFLYPKALRSSFCSGAGLVLSVSLAALRLDLRSTKAFTTPSASAQSAAYILLVHPSTVILQESLALILLTLTQQQLALVLALRLLLQTCPSSISVPLQ